MAGHTTAQVTEPLFELAGLSEGYDRLEVEIFLDDVLAELEGELPNPALAARIRDVMFTPVRFRRGYVMSAVDEALDELEVLASQGRSDG